MEVKRRIEYTPDIRRQIEESIGCSPAMISRALNYDKKTSLANAIRNEARRIGAKEIITANAEDVFLIEGNRLVWKVGNYHAIIDLERKTIIINDGDHDPKKIVLTIPTLITLIKEVQK